MTTERPDRGARALAERLAEAEHKRACEWRHPHSWTDHIAKQTQIADAILANGAVFLPDAAELERLRATMASALDWLDHGDTAAAAYELRKALHEAGPPPGRLEVAALEPEGSAQG